MENLFILRGLLAISVPPNAYTCVIRGKRRFLLWTSLLWLYLSSSEYYYALCPHNHNDKLINLNLVLIAKTLEID